MNNHRCGRAVICGSVGLLLAAVGGCQDSRRHEATEDVDLPPATTSVHPNASPKQVVQALFNHISQAQAIRAEGFGTPEEQKSYDLAIGQIRGLSHEEAIYDEVKGQADRSMTIPHNIGKIAALKLIIENWLSICAHYAGSFLVEEALVSAPDPKSGTVTAFVEAERPDDAERLRAIESLPEVQHEREKSGAVGTKGYQDYIQLVRSRALEQGFNYPIRARFRVLLKQVDSAWRVIHLDFAPPVAPAIPMPLPAAPTTQAIPAPTP